MSFTPFHRGGSGPTLLLLHGFLDTWRTWELVLPALERKHEVLALTLAGHAGGPALPAPLHEGVMADAVERALDAVGWEDVHVAGNSLGGYVALQLAARGRARSVVTFAPAGGWAPADLSRGETLAWQAALHAQLQAVAPYADAIVATAAGRRQVTAALVAGDAEHIPAPLLAHLIRGAAAVSDAGALVAFAAESGWDLAVEDIDCPVRIVWGTADALLPWPSAAKRYREAWVPHADWVELDGVGHCPQLEVPLEAAQLILGVTT